MNENEFTKQVIEVSRRFGWMAVHFRPGLSQKGRHMTTYLGDGKGYFDITAIRERVIFAELKIPPNKQSTEQQIWAKTAANAGCEVYLWTPADYDDIVRIFAGARPARSAVTAAL